MTTKTKPKAAKGNPWETIRIKPPSPGEIAKAFAERNRRLAKLERCPRCGERAERHKRGHFIVCVSCKQRIEIVGGTLCANCKTPLELTYRARHVGPYVYGPGNRIRRWSAIVHAKNGLESCPGTTAELPKLKRGRPAGLREDLGA